MSLITIEDFVCNLFAGENIIACLYEAFFQAQYLRSQGRTYCYKFKWPGLGCKIFRGPCIIQIECEACNRPLSQLYNEYCENRTLDSVMRLLFKGRLDITNLYKSRNKARELRQTGRQYCACIQNPYNNFIRLDKGKKVFRGCELLNLECRATGKKFINFFSC